MTTNALSLLETDVENWNQWRLLHPHKPIELAQQDLSHGYFFEGNLRGANLKGANLQRACLIGADLTGADLTGAYLGDANLTGANLSQANLSKANLDRADLRRTNLLGANIIEADIRTAQLPDPNIDPYMDEVVSLLAKQRLALANNNGSSTRYSFRAALPTPAKSAKNTAYNTAKYRQSLLRQMIDRSPGFGKESERAAMTRQQAIRQSAIIISHNVKRDHIKRERNPKYLARRQSDRRLAARVSRAAGRLSDLAKSIVF